MSRFETEILTTRKNLQVLAGPAGEVAPWHDAARSASPPPTATAGVRLCGESRVDWPRCPTPLPGQPDPRPESRRAGSERDPRTARRFSL